MLRPGPPTTQRNHPHGSVIICHVRVIRFSVPLLTLALAASLSAASVPKVSRDVSIDLPSGSHVTVSQYRGKVVVAAMILTTCPHCQATTRILSSLQKEFGPRGLQVIEGAILQPQPTDLSGFIRNFSPPFPVGSISYENAARFMGFDPTSRHYVPFLTFVDRKGNIRGQYDGKAAFNDENNQAKNIRETVIKLLAEK
jgi:thiol-disulfide isomerase/thioredoxin